MSTPIETIINSEEQSLSENGFFWRENQGVRVLVSQSLEAAGFANGFSTRLGGVSDFPENSLNLAGFDEDTAENIAENRRRFLSVFGQNFELSTVWQVHGNGVKTVSDRESAARTEEKYDAIVSDIHGILIGVKTADCVPILIGDPLSKSFAAVHAGWRGTVESIVDRAVKKLIENYGAEPENMIAAIGPAATFRNYEIGKDVIDAFEEKFSTSGNLLKTTRPGHALIDLHLANHDQLIACGVPSENISTAPLCTMERTDLFFSYRKEKSKYGKTGRLLSVIGRA